MAQAQRRTEGTQETQKPQFAMAVPRLALPRLVVRNGIQARRHMREIERDIRERIGRMDIADKRRILRRDFEGPIERISERVRLNRMNSEVLFWMDQAYLGRDLHRTFSAMPPFLSEESDRAFSRLDIAFGGHGTEQVIGRFFEGTNHIIMNEGILFNTTEAMALVAHEQLHYASWLGGGGSWQRWNSGKEESSAHCHWLHEGLTELHSQQLARSHGYHTKGVSYPPETAVSFYIQQIVGGDVLRSAYFSGDFSEVRRRLNSRLGENTFEVLVGRATIPADSHLAHLGPHIINGMEAVRFIRERMDESGIDRGPWRADAVLRAALDYLNLS